MRKLILAAVVVISPLALAQEKQGYAVHDMTRPQPTAVTPATPSTQ